MDLLHHVVRDVFGGVHVLHVVVVLERLNEMQYGPGALLIGDGHWCERQVRDFSRLRFDALVFERFENGFELMRVGQHFVILHVRLDILGTGIKCCRE